MANRKIQNVIAAVVVLLALIGLFFQEQIEDSWQQLRFDADSRPVIAKVERVSSKGVSYRAPETLTYHHARVHMGLHAKDTISTDDKSTAVISFTTGLQIELEPNSLIIIEDYTSGAGSLELSFLQGNGKILNQGAQKVFLTGSHLQKPRAEVAPEAPEIPLRLETAAVEVRPTPMPIALPKVKLEEKKVHARPTPSPIVEEKQTLPESYIASVIRNQRTFLNRCYAQHLRLNPDARGRIDTSITIEGDGSVSTARVIGSTIADPGLQQCVVSTLQRARFKAFNGDPIIVNYPINFE